MADNRVDVSGYEKLTDNNYVAWRDTVIFLLRVYDLEDTWKSAFAQEGLNTSEKEKQNKGLKIIGGLLPARMIQVIKSAKTVSEAMEAIASQMADKNPTTRAAIQQQMNAVKFKEIAKTREFLKEIEDHVERYKMSGGSLDDKEHIMMLRLKMQNAGVFDIDFRTLTDFDSYQGVKKKLIRTMEVELAKRAHAEGEIANQLEMLSFQKPSGSGDYRRGRGFGSGRVFGGGRGFSGRQYGGRPSFSNIRCHICSEPGHTRYFCPLVEEYAQQKKSKAVNNMPKLNKDDDMYTGVLMANSVDLPESEDMICFILDSGATHHFYHDRCQFPGLKQTSARTVRLANGDSCAVKGVTDIKTVGQTFKDVIIVPGMPNGLMSMAQLVDKGYKILLDKDDATILDKDLKTKLIAPRVGNLWAIMLQKRTDGDVDAHALSVNWHNVLGHPGTDKLRRLAICEKDITCTEEVCSTCQTTNIKQGPFHRTEIRTTQPLQLVHCDVAGPHQAGYNEAVYFIVFVDDFSRFTKVYVMKNRTEVLEAFKKYRQFAQGLSGHMIRRFRTDQARELVSKEFELYLRDNAIWHEKSTAHSHQQNGIAERYIQSVRCKSRTNLGQAKMPEKFWPEAVKTAAYQMNCLPSKAINEEVPYTRFFGEKPDYGFMKEFGAVASVWQHRTQRETVSNFAPRGKECVMMGYQDDMKAYRLWDPIDKKMVLSCNARVQNGKYYQWDVSIPSTTYDLADVQDEPVRDQMQQMPPSHENENSDVEEVIEETDRPEMITSPRVSLSPTTSVQSPVIASVPLRRSARNRRPPVRFDPNDPSTFSTQVKMQANDVPIPKSYDEAMKSPYAKYWQEACLEELNSIQGKGVYSEVEPDVSRKVITTRWVFTRKENPDDGTIERFKARIVVHGYKQEYGVDYDEVYAPVVGHTTIRCFLTHAAAKRMKVHHVDVKTAFLNSELDCDVYVKPPEGVAGDVWKLRKSLYGLRQAPKCWFEKIDSIMKDLGFRRLGVDKCVFVNTTGKSPIYVLLYVDDLLVACEDDDQLMDFKRKLNMKVETRDLGPVSLFLGLQIMHDDERELFIVSQEKFIADCIEKFGLKDAKQKSLPTVESLNFESPDLDAVTQRQYRGLIGSLMYIANQTRPDVCFAVNYMSRFMQKAKQLHLRYARNLLAYIGHTRHRKLHLGQLSGETLEGYADASYGVYSDAHSQSGWLFKYHGSVVSWCSRKQDTISQSTTEAEYVALANATNECLWLRQLLQEWGVTFDKPTPIHEDNQAVIKLVHSNQINTRAKYLSVKLASVQDLIMRLHLDVVYIASKDQWADMLTKAKIPPDVDMLFNGLHDQRGCET